MLVGFVSLRNVNIFNLSVVDVPMADNLTPNWIPFVAFPHAVVLYISWKYRESGLSLLVCPKPQWAYSPKMLISNNCVIFINESIYVFPKWKLLRVVIVARCNLSRS